MILLDDSSIFRTIFHFSFMKPKANMPQRRDLADGAPKIHHMFRQLGAAHKHSFTALTLTPREPVATGCWSLSRRRGSSGGGESESFAAPPLERAPGMGALLRGALSACSRRLACYSRTGPLSLLARVGLPRRLLSRALLSPLAGLFSSSLRSLSSVSWLSAGSQK